MMVPLKSVDSSKEAAVFRFKTKARNLAQLIDRLEYATVLPLEIVTVRQWREDPPECLLRLRSAFREDRIIVRSSAPSEDSLEASQAGAFESVGNVDPRQADELEAAFSTVIDSYRNSTDSDVDGYEILVQRMVPDVRMSGVVFTRDLDKNAPYFVLNYDNRTNRTDTVTGGASEEHEVLRIFKGTNVDLLDADIAKVVRMALELEQVTLSDSLDIEFAIDARGRTYVLQVRPLARTRILSFARLDHRVGRELESMKQFVRAKLAPKPNLYGQRAILGEMPDWNPAEIIGTHPKPLAESLYRHLIMRSTWREARAVIGYRHPFPYQLMTMVGGRPYVDVRASFNSFLPKGLPDVLAEKLVNHYLARLQEFPELHDKIEFEIVVSCLTFDFDVHATRLLSNGFSETEVDTLGAALRTLTEEIVTDAEGVLVSLERKVAQLGPRRRATLESHRDVADLPMVVEQLLDDCITYGTLPFSVFARCAFIGSAFLRSLVHKKVLSDDEYGRYLQGIDTVATAFVRDLESSKASVLPLRIFLSKYGHLRPGTYDICTYTYAERPDLYLALTDEQTPGAESTLVDADHGVTEAIDDKLGQLPDGTLRRAKELLVEFGYSFGMSELERFIRSSIRLRESMKFEFTKNLSAALNLIVELGQYHGLSREDLSFLDIHDILSLSTQNFAEDHISHLRTLIDRNRNRSEVTAAINLPDLIFDELDVEIVSLQRRRPNFTSNKRVVANAYRLDDLGALEEPDILKGKIVMIENADPGYDWLFGKAIAGLVTKYGGAASHMAIRCAEFGLPAAIGCGEQIFDELLKSNSILLDCVEQRVEAYGS
jgi:glutamine kinase